MSDTLYDLMQIFAGMAPRVHIGCGPRHPTSPHPELAEQTERWLRLYPFLMIDSGYVDFLRRYSGADASDPESGFDVHIAGFTGFGGVLNEIGPFTYDDETTGIDEHGLYPFAVTGIGQDVMEFSFDGTGRRPWGVYRRYRRKQETHWQEVQGEWDCGTFLDWLTHIVESRGR